MQTLKLTHNSYFIVLRAHFSVKNGFEKEKLWGNNILFWKPQSEVPSCCKLCDLTDELMSDVEFRQPGNAELIKFTSRNDRWYGLPLWLEDL